MKTVLPTELDPHPNPSLEGEIRRLLNLASAENASNTPDHILARYLISCLEAYNRAVIARAVWYRRLDSPGGDLVVLDEGPL